MSAFDALIESAQDDLEKTLDELGATTDDVRKIAKQVLELGLEITVARLSGKNTDIAEKAIGASVQSLAAIQTDAVARGVVNFVHGQLLKLLKVVTSAAIADL